MRVEGLLGSLSLRREVVLFFSPKAPFPRCIKSPQIVKNLRALRVRNYSKLKEKNLIKV